MSEIELTINGMVGYVSRYTSHEKLDAWIVEAGNSSQFCYERFPGEEFEEPIACLHFLRIGRSSGKIFEGSSGPEYVKFEETDAVHRDGKVSSVVPLQGPDHELMHIPYSYHVLTIGPAEGKNKVLSVHRMVCSFMTSIGAQENTRSKTTVSELLHRLEA